MTKLDEKFCIALSDPKTTGTVRALRHAVRKTRPKFGTKNAIGSQAKEGGFGGAAVSLFACDSRAFSVPNLGRVFRTACRRARTVPAVSGSEMAMQNFSSGFVRHVRRGRGSAAWRVTRPRRCTCRTEWKWPARTSRWRNLWRSVAAADQEAQIGSPTWDAVLRSAQRAVLQLAGPVESPNGGGLSDET